MCESVRPWPSKIDGKVDAKDMWATIRQLTGRQNITTPIDGITAESLNDHYAAITSDPCYISPIRKPYVDHGNEQYISDFQVFKILDKLRPTAMGIDLLSAWFLRLGAPAMETSKHPTHTQELCPKLDADFRPISITPVLTRNMEQTIVQQFLYPAFLSPPPTLIGLLHD